MNASSSQQLARRLSLIGAALSLSATALAQAPAVPDFPPDQVTAVVSNGPTPRQALLVGEKGAGLLTVIDPDTLEIVARIPVGNQPHEVTAAGKYAFVSNSGAGAMTMVDLETQTRMPSVDTGAMGSLHGLWSAGGKAYVFFQGAKILARFDPDLGKFDMATGMGFGSHLLMVSPDEKTFIFASSDTHEAIIMQYPDRLPTSIPAPRAAGGGRRGGGGGRGAGAAGGGQARGARGGGGGGGGRGGAEVITTTFPGGQRLEGFDISPDGQELWLININEKTVSVNSIPEKRVLETFDLPTNFTNRIRFTLDGKYVLLSSLMNGDHELLIYDAKTRKEVKRIDVGAGGEGIFMDPRGGRAYYAVSNGGKLAVIDTNTLTLVKYIEGLRTPDGMAWYSADQ